MSQNAIALKSPVSKRPDRRIRSLRAIGDPVEPEPSTGSTRVAELKELVHAVLRELQRLEHDQLVAELTPSNSDSHLEIEGGTRFEDVVRRFEINLIRRALLLTAGNQSKAARLLGIKPNTLSYKIKIYGISAGNDIS